MFIYNVTCNISNEMEEEWIQWMIETHIPEVLNTGCFTDCRILKLLTEVEDNSGINYAIQYSYEHPKDFERYSNEFGPGLQAKTKAKYGDRVLAFRTHLALLTQF